MGLEKAASLGGLKAKLRELGDTIQNRYLQFIVAAGIDGVRSKKHRGTILPRGTLRVYLRSARSPLIHDRCALP